MKKKNLIIIGIIIIVIIGIILLFTFNRNKKPIKIKDADINIGGYNQKISVKEVENDVTIDNKKYVKVYLEIENKKDVESITALHQFYIVNSNNYELSQCYHDGIVSNDKFTDMLSNKIPANDIISGYLYCLITDTRIDRLKIRVIKGGSIDKENNITYEYKDYYLDLT